MALKEGERFNVDTMAIEKIPAVVEQKAETPKEEKEAEETKEEEPEVKPSEEKESELAAEESEEEEEEEKKPETEKEEDVIDENDYIKGEYSEKYEIKSKAELDGVLDSIDNLMNRNKELEVQLKEAKDSATEPQFKSEAQKKLWEFMQDVDPDKLGERLQTYSNLIAIDVEKGDPKRILQEQYILQHPAWTREEALMKFDRAYARNYTAKQDDFDTDEEYKAEIKSKELDMKDDVLKAKEFLKKQQEQFKPKDEDKPVENVALKRAIEQTASEVDKYVFTKLVFSPTDDEEDNYSVELSDKQIKEIKNAMKAWVSNPNSYDGKGELLGGWDVDQKSVQVAFMLFGPDIVQKNYEHALNLKNITRAEEIATRKPDRKAKTAGDNPTGQLSEEKQWEMAIKKKKANQNGRQMVYK
jgi:hypothetical protein